MNKKDKSSKKTRVEHGEEQAKYFKKARKAPRLTQDKVKYNHKKYWLESEDDDFYTKEEE